MIITKALRFSLVVLLFLVSGCGRYKQSSGTVIARVNNARLTLDEIEKRRLKLADENASAEYVVSRWVNNELLYQAALENDFDRDSSLNQNVEDYRRSLFAGAYLEAVVQNSTSITNADVKTYYDAHKSSFMRTVEEAKIYHFVFDNAAEARRARTVLSQNRSGGERKELFSSYRVDAVTVKKGFLLEALDENIFNSRSNKRVIGPVKIKNKYHVIEVLSRFPKGSQTGLGEAYEEIYQRLLQKQTALKQLFILDSLRSKAFVEINLEILE